MRFASLASGSRGNALIVEHGPTLVMIDCGLSLKAVKSRLSSLGRRPTDVTALLVTHEHSDHMRGVAAYSQRYGTPVWATAGTAAAGSLTALARFTRFHCGSPLEIGDVTVEPFTVPHDAREPSQFAFVAGRRRLGILTDTGHVTAHVRERLSSCDALAIEFNHDLDALWGGDYPEHVKRRIASRHGHLDNGQAADLVRELGGRALQWVMALHLSEANNTRASVRQSLEAALGGARSADAHVAAQHETSDWLEIV